MCWLNESWPKGIFLKFQIWIKLKSTKRFWQGKDKSKGQSACKALTIYKEAKVKAKAKGPKALIAWTTPQNILKQNSIQVDMAKAGLKFERHLKMGP